MKNKMRMKISLEASQGFFVGFVAGLAICGGIAVILLLVFLI